MVLHLRLRVAVDPMILSIAYARLNNPRRTPDAVAARSAGALDASASSLLRDSRLRMRCASVSPVTGFPTRRSKPTRQVSTMSLSRFRPVTAIRSTRRCCGFARRRRPHSRPSITGIVRSHRTTPGWLRATFTKPSHPSAASTTRNALTPQYPDDGSRGDSSSLTPARSDLWDA